MTYPPSPPPSALLPVPPPAPLAPAAPVAPVAPVAYARVAVPAFAVTEAKSGPGLLVRALWFVLVGWWATALVATLAWAALITIIGLPLGIWLVNRVPTVLTLRPRTSRVYTWTDAYGRQTFTMAAQDQPPWIARGLWFLLVGWWASGLAMAVGYGLVLTIIGLPLGLLVFNRVPFVASLYRY